MRREEEIVEAAQDRLERLQHLVVEQADFFAGSGVLLDPVVMVEPAWAPQQMCRVDQTLPRLHSMRRTSSGQ
jgi:hypothetical protein